MGGKAAIAAGLFTGLVAGAFVVGGVVVLAPGAVVPSKAPVAEASPSPVPSASPAASASPSPSVPPTPSATPSPAASASPSGSPTVAPPSVAPSGAEASGIGQPATRLTVLQLGGDVIELSALTGTPVWITFVTTTCLPCRDQLPVMNSLSTRYADSGLVVIAVDVREEEATVDAFARELGITFPVALDTEGTGQSEWGVTTLPAHFWIDADGIVRASASGVVDADAMAAGLRTILPGVEVTP